MSCPQCGNPAAVSRGTCTQCNKVGGGLSIEDAERTRKAGSEAGYGLVLALHWVLTNRYLSYVWFWLIWATATSIIGLKYGLISEDWEKSSFAYELFIGVVPIVIAVVFRRQVEKYIPMLFEKLLQLAAWAITIGFCVLLGKCAWETVT